MCVCVCVRACSKAEGTATDLFYRQTATRGKCAVKMAALENWQDWNTKESNFSKHKKKRQKRRVCIKRNVGVSAVFYVEGQCRARNILILRERITVLWYQGKIFKTGFFFSETNVSPLQRFKFSLAVAVIKYFNK